MPTSALFGKRLFIRADVGIGPYICKKLHPLPGAVSFLCTYFFTLLSRRFSWASCLGVASRQTMRMV